MIRMTVLKLGLRINSSISHMNHTAVKTEHHSFRFFYEDIVLRYYTLSDNVLTSTNANFSDRSYNHD
jgi:hypothetical protein